MTDRWTRGDDRIPHDSNTEKYKLTLTVVEFDKNTGKNVLDIAYDDGIHDAQEQVVFESSKIGGEMKSKTAACMI